MLRPPCHHPFIYTLDVSLKYCEELISKWVGCICITRLFLISFLNWNLWAVLAIRVHHNHTASFVIGSGVVPTSLTPLNLFRVAACFKNQGSYIDHGLNVGKGVELWTVWWDFLIFNVPCDNVMMFYRMCYFSAERFPFRNILFCWNIYVYV